MNRTLSLIASLGVTLGLTGCPSKSPFDLPTELHDAVSWIGVCEIGYEGDSFRTTFQFSESTFTIIEEDWDEGHSCEGLPDFVSESNGRYSLGEFLNTDDGTVREIDGVYDDGVREEPGTTFSDIFQISEGRLLLGDSLFGGNQPDELDFTIAYGSTPDRTAANLDKTCSNDRFERDNNFDDAREIGLGEIQQHNFCDSGADVVVFDVVSGGEYVLRTFDLEDSSDTAILLYDRDRNLVDEDDDGGGGLASRVEFQADYTGIYYAEIRPFYAPFDGGDDTGYSLTFE